MEWIEAEEGVSCKQTVMDKFNGKAKEIVRMNEAGC